MASFVLVGCASGQRVTTVYKKPETMSPLDAQIASAECQKDALMARKAYIKAHGTPQGGGLESPLFKAQQTAYDQCLRDRGITIKQRTVS